jgi:lipopolysaccharide export system permease protein
MPTIPRYVVWEVLKVFLLVITATTLLMVLGGGVKEAIRKGLPIPLMVEILPYMLPETLRFTIPGCLLFAVCLVFGRMSGANELVALKTAGISPLAVIWPVLALAIVLSVVTFEFYNLCATWGRPNLKRAVIESVEEIAYGFLRAEKSFRTNKFSINVKDVVGRKLIKPIIVLTPGKGGGPAVTLTAAEAEIRTDRQKRWLRFVCRNGELDVAGEGKLWFTDTEEQVVPLDDSPHDDPYKLSPAALGVQQIPEQVHFEQKQVADLRAQHAKQRQRQEEPSRKGLQLLKSHQLRLWRLRAESHRRWSNGFNCLSFALIGISVALSYRWNDNLSIFFVCFLPILLVFYPLLVLGEYVATKGLLPPGAVWLPNVFLFGWALLFLQRVMRY